MKNLGGIQLPVKTPQIINISSNQDAIDFLLDLSLPDKDFHIRTMYNDVDTNLNIIKAFTPVKTYPYNFNVYVLVITNPPAFLCKFKGQKYFIIIAKLLVDMNTFFKYYKFAVRSVNDFKFITAIIKEIENHLIKYNLYGIY